MFNPYHKWLGIPESNGPPTHYQLLGISPAECDPDVIQAAAVRQSSYIRNFQTGKYAQDATRILTEIAAAKTCLLDLGARAKYDVELEERNSKPSRPAGKSAPGSASPYDLAANSEPAPPAIRASGPTTVAPRPTSPAPVVAAPQTDLFTGVGAARGLRSPAPRVKRRKESNPFVVMAIAFGAVAILVGTAIAIKRSGDKTVVIEESKSKSEGITGLFEDEKPRSVPRYVAKDPELEKQIQNAEKDLAKKLADEKDAATPWVEATGEAIHLLEGVNQNRDSLGGRWLIESDGVLSPKQGVGILRLAGNVPEEYRLKLEVSRLSNSGALGVALVAGKRRFLAILDDGAEKKVSGVELLDDRRITQNPNAIAGEWLPYRKNVSIVFEVRKGWTSASIDGRAVFNYEGSYERLRMPVEAIAGRDDELLLVSKEGEFFIKNVDLIGITFVKQSQ